jgi:hypothetical protein
MEKQPAVMGEPPFSHWTDTPINKNSAPFLLLSSSSIQLLMAITQQYYVVLSSHLQKMQHICPFIASHPHHHPLPHQAHSYHQFVQ